MGANGLAGRKDTVLLTPLATVDIDFDNRLRVDGSSTATTVITMAFISCAQPTAVDS
jgi:hypothetical protein